MKFKFKYQLLIGLIFIVLFSYGQFQTEQERKVYANNLFEQGEFIEAEPHMLHFLSLENTTEYSYKYGVCALYTYADKSKAIRFLTYAVKDKEVDVEAFFYLGKAYHLNYLFNDAIRNYELFKSKSTSKIQKEFLIEMHLSMCVSGKSLMQNLTDLVVEDKIESSSDRFQYSYDFSKIGGRILVTDEFQSKYDKKVGYRSVIYFPPLNQNLIFFSSYGKDGSNGLDLYKVYRLPEGGWSEPVRLPNHINTQYDDAFPFLHSDGKTFYFSSMGHSSMGGYDIFRTFYEEETNSFGPPSNMDYKINTPSDDIMYVVDSLNQNAFFSSSRASKGDFLDVYKVRVEVFPIQNVIIAGEFFNEIDNTDIDAKIQIVDLITEEVIGIFHPNDQRKYTIILPKSGKYKFLVETPKSERIHAGMVEVMPQKELKLLKQEILLASNDGNEQLIIKNLFDQTVENESEILAEVMRELSTPEINFDEFPDSLFIEDLSIDEDLIITDPLNSNEDVDLVSISNEIALEARNEADEIENKMNASFLVAQKKSDDSKAASKQAQEILKNIDEIENPLERQQQADLANEYHEKSKELNQQAVTAINVANSLKTQHDKKEKEAEESQEIANAISKAIQDDSHEEALAHLSELQNKINDIIEEDNELNNSIDEKEIQAKSLELKAKEHLKVGQELREEQELIQVKLANAEREKNTAKKQKDKDEIQLKINQFQEELALNNQMADDEFLKYEQLIDDSKNINAEVEMLAELDEIVETNPIVEISEEQKEIVEQQVLSDDVSQEIEDNEKLLSEIPNKNTLSESENLETNEADIVEDVSLLNQSENIQNQSELNSNEEEIVININDQRVVNDNSSNELINKQEVAYKEVIAVLENSESTNYDYSDSFNESISYNSKSSTEKLENIDNDLEMLMVAKQELASLEYESQNEVKESKKVENQKDIDNKKEIISEMETNLSSSFEQVMVAEKQNNDSLFSSVEDVLTPELLVDEDFLSAKYYNDQAQKQYVLAQNLKKEAQNQNDNNKKAELLREAHQYELAAVENQQDALNLLDEIEVPAQSIDLAQENENSAEIDETPIDNPTQDVSEENTANLPSNETDEQELAIENESSVEIDESPIENTTQDVSEENTANLPSNETDEQELAIENENSAEMDKTPIDNPIQDVSEENTAKLPSNETDEQELAIENENSAEIDETPIDKPTQDVVEENISTSNSNETDEQGLAIENENSAEIDETPIDKPTQDVSEENTANLPSNETDEQDLAIENENSAEIDETPIDKPTLDVSEENTANLPSNETDEQDLAIENENSAEIDETPIDNPTQDVSEENTANSTSNETDEQELASENENRTEVTNDATVKRSSQENLNNNSITVEVVKQTVAGEEFESDSDPEVYQVAAVFNEDSPITIDNYSNSFSTNKLQTVQQDVNEVIELEKEISVLNKELAATEDEKQIKKIAKKIESLKAEKIENELELADVYKEVNQSELEIAKAKVDVVKEQSMALVNNSYEFKQANEYEKAGDFLEEKAIGLRKEAENENDINKKNELLLKASNAELSALDKLETAKKLYAEALVEDVSVSSAISPKQLNTSFTSIEVATKANDVNENALVNENRAVELRADAENAKPNEKLALLNEATKLEELAKEEKALANQLFNKSNRIKLYEDAIVEQQDLAANLSEADAAEVVTTKEYDTILQSGAGN